MEPEQPGEVGQVEFMAPQPEEFEFVYAGPEVATGSMEANEVVDVLTGLTRTFSTIVNEMESNERLQLRVKDVEPGSFRIIFELIQFAKENPAAMSSLAATGAVVLSAVTLATSGGYRVVTDIAKLIYAKTKLKGAKVATQRATFDDGAVTLELPDEKGLLVLTKEQYELLLSKRLDKHLSQIVSPLEAKRIDSFEMRRAATEMVKVEASQRGYFDYFEVTEEKSKEGTQIVGTLNSLSKSSLRGTFHTSEGVHVPYKYVGGDVGQLLQGFAARELVRVHGKIKYGSDGLPTHIEAQNIDILQRKIFDE
jgi:hypothetical protein